jgi:hypothetical protein
MVGKALKRKEQKMRNLILAAMVALTISCGKDETIQGETVIQPVETIKEVTIEKEVLVEGFDPAIVQMRKAYIDEIVVLKGFITTLKVGHNFYERVPNEIAPIVYKWLKFLNSTSTYSNFRIEGGSLKFDEDSQEANYNWGTYYCNFTLLGSGEIQAMHCLADDIMGTNLDKSVTGIRYMLNVRLGWWYADCTENPTKAKCQMDQAESLWF